MNNMDTAFGILEVLHDGKLLLTLCDQISSIWSTSGALEECRNHNDLLVFVSRLATLGVPLVFWRTVVNGSFLLISASR